MLSKPLLSWSRHQTSSETSSRTGRLFPTLKRRASKFVLLPSDDRQNESSPATTHYATALASAVGNLHEAVNCTLCSRSSSIHRPPRSRAWSASAPLVEQIHKPDSTNTSQDDAISTLQAHSYSSREAYESHMNILKRWRSVEVASLESQARMLKERTNKHDFQDVSSSSWLVKIDSSNSPHIPVPEHVKDKSPVIEPTYLNLPSHGESTGRQISPQRPLTSPETDNLKGKPFGAERLESTTQALLSELRIYQRGKTIFQKQIDSLTKKLSKSVKNERELRDELSMAKKESVEKAVHINKLTDEVQVLHNTVSHLKSCLEIANTKRLDAEEELLVWRDQKTAFGLICPQLFAPSDTKQGALNVDTGTIMNPLDRAATSFGVDCSEKRTSAALIARIEDLEAQAKEKDAYAVELRRKYKQLRQNHNKLELEHKRVAVQSDLQYELLREIRASDKVIEQLRTAAFDRESKIMETVETIDALRRQLECHKLLLQAEIRRQTAIQLSTAPEEHLLPELTSLTRREDIDCWVEKLHERLRSEQSGNESRIIADTPEAKVESLHREIDFYIREIVLFKLDVKGYRSDIRRLKEANAYQSSLRN